MWPAVGACVVDSLLPDADGLFDRYMSDAAASIQTAALFGVQGAHGMWELSVNKAHHADIVENLLEALVAQLACPDLQVGAF